MGPKNILNFISEDLRHRINANKDLVTAEDEPFQEHQQLPLERISEILIFKIAYFVRRKLGHSKLYSFYFVIFAHLPAIFINIFKIGVNYLNGTLISLCFDTSGEAQMLDRIGSLRIIIYPNDHTPPHFHVRTEYHNVRFSIADCMLIQNKRTKYFFKSKDMQAILNWHQQNKHILEEVWNKYNINR